MFSSSADFCPLTGLPYFPFTLLDRDPTSSQAPDTYIPHPSPPGSFFPEIGPYFCLDQSGRNRTIPINHASYQDTKTPGLLDTRKWSASPGFTDPRMITESIFLPMDAGFFLPHSYSNDTSMSNHAMGHDMPQVSTLLVPDPNLGFLDPMRTRNGDATFNIGLRADHTNLLASNSLPQFPTSSFTECVTCSVGGKGKSPLPIYRSPDKKRSGRRRSRHARAVNIGGMKIDEDNLYSGTGSDCRIISVHECQWNKSDDPCGMWIVGSRTRVGVHIRKWHKRSHTNNSTRCLWDGCIKTMLKDSINRHVVTVHLGEGYHCQGCDQMFSRQDVYDKHVEDDEACRDAGAIMVYGAECRAIDTNQMLCQEFVMQGGNSM